MKSVIILTVISLVAGLCLSGVYILTKDQIEIARKAEFNNSLKIVLPFLKDKYEEVPPILMDGESIPIFPVVENGVLQGAGLQLTGKNGYAGNIKILLGIDKSQKITGLQIIEHKETPGLGTKAADETWWGQFKGKSLGSFKFKVKKDGGDVDAITAATITSRSVTNAVDQGLRVYAEFAKSFKGMGVPRE